MADFKTFNFKTFKVEMYVHLLDDGSIDVDNMVAKDQVDRMVERVECLDTELITGGKVRSVRDVSNKDSKTTEGENRE